MLGPWRHIAPELAGKVQTVRKALLAGLPHSAHPASAGDPRPRQRGDRLRRRISPGDPGPGTPDHQAEAAEPSAPRAPPPAARTAPDESKPGPGTLRYLAALAAHQRARSGGLETDSLVRAKVERQIRDRIREPEHQFGEAAGRKTGSWPHTTTLADPGPAMRRGIGPCNASPPNGPG